MTASHHASKARGSRRTGTDQPRRLGGPSCRPLLVLPAALSSSPSRSSRSSFRPVWRSRVSRSRRRVQAHLRRSPQFPEAAPRRPAISFPRHLQCLGSVAWLLLALITAALLVASVAGAPARSPCRLPRPRHLDDARRRAGAVVRATILSDGFPGTLGHHALLCRLRRDRAIPARHRPRASLRQADPRPELLPRRLLHAADGDAGRHRLHLPHARRHDGRPFRAAQPLARPRRMGWATNPGRRA